MKNLSVISLRFVLCALLLLGGLTAGDIAGGGRISAQAQSMPQNVAAQQKTIVEDLRRQIEDIGKALDKSKNNDETLANIKVKLEGISKKLLDAGLAFRPRLSEINSRLDQMGPPPAEGKPAESEIVATERARLTAEKAEINTVIGFTEDASVQASQLIEKIGSMRRDLFTQTLSQRVDINTELVTEVVNAAGYETKTFFYLLKSWWDFTLYPRLWTLLGVLAISVIPALLIHLSARRWLADLYERDPLDEKPSYLSRLSVAFWSTVIPSVAVVVFLGLVYLLFQRFNLLRPDIAQLLAALFTLLFIVLFIYRLACGVLSPDMPNWRLLPVAPKPAQILIWLLTAAAITQSIEYFLEILNGVMSSPLSLTVAKSVIGTAMVGALLLAIAFLKPIQNPKTGELRSWPRLTKIILILLGLMPILAAVFGYIGFARFIAQQIVVTGAFIVTMYLGFLTARAITHEKAFANTSLGRKLRDKFNANEATLDQLGLVAGIVINLIVLLIGVPLVLMQFGFQWSEMSTLFIRIMTGFQIGSFSISLISILTGILLFVMGYFLTRLFQNWLDGSVMARGRVDAGVRNSIKTVIGYVGLALSALLAISAAGIDLSSFALVAGGLSLGIGFGLQNIVSNFVSGLILLAERPLKVGDWVQTGTVSGFVKKISVRATEVETFQRETIIVPNSTLINDNVGNWTHRNKLGRSDMQILIGYRTDVRRIQAMLFEIARETPLVLKNPEPMVFLINMTELVSSNMMMRFEIRIFLADITSALGVRNELQFTIVERFAAEGISVMPLPSPIPLPELHVNSEENPAG
ncbi:mechanosensitive ion channel [Pseudochrobactrum sp. sp1633]|uniref:mechanosensitive ion channel domain-containing protein n=1 Tax=Pseudochrobactrum sp. sp1633 TaxID=3036706 RepID=UPI0025A55165|nr:mechanosensitive ion channel domain-containing protein [Pseudochrobactrum sp. sp1633]MDM8343826.1 mechanosensitive ion channel [Pseudochrobactrum sp. sp1633]